MMLIPPSRPEYTIKPNNKSSMSHGRGGWTLTLVSSERSAHYTSNRNGEPIRLPYNHPRSTRFRNSSDTTFQNETTIFLEDALMYGVAHIRRSRTLVLVCVPTLRTWRRLRCTPLGVGPHPVGRSVKGVVGLP